MAAGWVVVVVDVTVIVALAAVMYKVRYAVVVAPDMIWLMVIVLVAPGMTAVMVGFFMMMVLVPTITVFVIVATAQVVQGGEVGGEVGMTSVLG